MDKEITITKTQLRAAMLAWEQSFRSGKTRSVEETAAMTPEQVADESATALWDALANTEAALG